MQNPGEAVCLFLLRLYLFYWIFLFLFTVRSTTAWTKTNTSMSGASMAFNYIPIFFITCSVSWKISGLTLARHLPFHQFRWLPYSGIRSVNLRSTGSRGCPQIFKSFIPMGLLSWDRLCCLDQWFRHWCTLSFITYTYTIANRHNFFIYRIPRSYTILTWRNSFLYFYLCYLPSSSTINFTSVIWRDQELIRSCHPVAHGAGMGIPTLGCSQSTSNLDVVDASLR